MHIVKDEPHRVIADRIQLEDLYVLLAANGAPLARRMALLFGARTAHAQIFGRQIKTFAAVEGHRKRLAILMESQFRRPRSWFHFRHHQSSVMWPSSMTFFHLSYSDFVKALPSCRLV